MSEAAHFAYAQARLQSRHGARPDELLWRRLESIGELGSYLQAARNSTLRPWVMALHVTNSSHEIELSLRRQFRSYVDEVAYWLPRRWKETLRWVKRLPDLPALQHLLGGNAAPAWMLDDSALRHFTTENIAFRTEVLESSDCFYLVKAWQQGSSLVDAWIEYWQSQWPKEARYIKGLEYLRTLLQQYTQEAPSISGISTEQHRETIVPLLNSAFRRFSFQPAAAHAHLALIALDLQKLRGDLVLRALFTNPRERRA